VNLQPAEHLLFRKQFSKMFSSAFRVLDPPGPDPGGGGGDQTCAKNFLGQVEMFVRNFIKIGAGVWISISPPHTNRQTDKQTPVRPFLYLL